MYWCWGKRIAVSLMRGGRDIATKQAQGRGCVSRSYFAATDLPIKPKRKDLVIAQVLLWAKGHIVGMYGVATSTWVRSGAQSTDAIDV